MINIIKNEIERLESQGLPPAKLIYAVDSKLYPLLPTDHAELMQLFDDMIADRAGYFFHLVTMWVKKKKMLYQLSYMPFYENWLNEHTNRWGTCDILCYRVLNPMVERYPQLFENVMRWAESPKTYVRRAAPVSLLDSGRGFSVNCDSAKVFTVTEKLKNDREVHVQKGVGWLLKYAYLAYPDEVYCYLKNNVENLPRVVFRYAVEKTPARIRKELMNL